MSEGIVLVDKPKGITSFRLVTLLRKKCNEKKVGHAGTLDPFATGLMVMLVGKKYTRKAESFINQDKQYIATLRLGQATDSYDCDGQVTHVSDVEPTREAVEQVLAHFQGTITQIPPMFSAKKVGGKKLYELARKGITIERKPIEVTLTIKLLDYTYPNVLFLVDATKGTYIRTLAHDIGHRLGCFGHLVELRRTACGPFHLKEATSYETLTDPEAQLTLKSFYTQIDSKLAF